MDAVFKALADTTRRDILDRLFQADGQSLGALVDGMGMTRQAVTKHLGVLEKAGLVSVRWQGREKRHYLNPVPVQQIHQRWVAKFAVAPSEALVSLKQRLEDDDND